MFIPRPLWIGWDYLEASVESGWRCWSILNCNADWILHRRSVLKETSSKPTSGREGTYKEVRNGDFYHPRFHLYKTERFIFSSSPLLSMVWTFIHSNICLFSSYWNYGMSIEILWLTYKCMSSEYYGFVGVQQVFIKVGHRCFYTNVMLDTIHYLGLRQWAINRWPEQIQLWKHRVHPTSNVPQIMDSVHYNIRIMNQTRSHPCPCKMRGWKASR